MLSAVRPQTCLNFCGITGNPQPNPNCESFLANDCPINASSVGTYTCVGVPPGTRNCVWNSISRECYANCSGGNSDPPCSLHNYTTQLNCESSTYNRCTQAVGYICNTTTLQCEECFGDPLNDCDFLSNEFYQCRRSCASGANCNAVGGGFVCSPCYDPNPNNCDYPGQGGVGMAACQNALPNCQLPTPPPPIPTDPPLASVDWSRVYQLVFPNSGAFGRFSTSLTLGTIVSALLRYVFPLAGLLLLIYLLYGGFQYLTSGGDPQKTDHAKKIITAAFIGFIIVFISYWIVQISAKALGVIDIERVVRSGDPGTCICVNDAWQVDNCNFSYGPYCSSPTTCICVPN